jgi:hypothetical protein
MNGAEIDLYRKWASVICHPSTGLRQLTIMKRDPPSRMPSHAFGILLFLFCPCSLSFSFTASCLGRNGGSRRTDRVGAWCSCPTPKRAAPTASGAPPTMSRLPRRAPPCQLPTVPPLPALPLLFQAAAAASSTDAVTFPNGL